jgi:hypothetical protein
MRRIMASALAVAAALLVVSTATAASPNSVTISLSRPSVVYGGTVTLSGKVSGAKSGENVEVLAVPVGQTSFASLTTVQSTSGGHWSTAVKPTIETIYGAKWKGQLSSTRHGEGAARDRAWAEERQRCDRHLLNHGDGSALVRRQVRARAAACLEGRDHAEEGDA